MRTACLFLVAIIIGACHAFTVTVEANTEECFFEAVTRGEKVMGSYHVVSGGNADVDVKVIWPSLSPSLLFSLLLAVHLPRAGARLLKGMVEWSRATLVCAC